MPLAEHFIDAVCQRTGRSGPLVLDPEARDLLKSLPWYGNVRELQNLVEGIVQLYPAQVILPRHIREYLGLQEEASCPAPPEAPVRAGPAPAAEPTRERVEEALAACRYNRTRAAAYLGISRTTLYRWMERLDMKP